MSDEQGDAEFEASRAEIPQGAGPAGAAPSAPAAASDVSAVQELRAAIEELARRMGAGFREDLAQIRAIASAVAERDLTDDVRALRREVGALAASDAVAPVREELAGVRSALDRLASGDDVAGLRAELAPVQATLDRIAARLDDDSGRAQVVTRFQSLESKLDEQAQQLGRLVGDLRAHLADALGALDGDAVLAELAALRRQLGTDGGTVVEQLQDHLADVASGEVVGALWDEVRVLREVVDASAAAPAGPVPGGADVAEVLETLATLRSEVEGLGAGLAAAAEPTADPAVAGLRDDVRAVHDEVRALGEAIGALEQAAAEAGPGTPDAVGAVGADEADPVLGELAEELATLRSELAEGLVVEPSDALSASLDALRVEVDGLRSSLAEMAEAAARPAAEPAPEPAPAGPSADVIATLLDELAGVRAGVDEVRDRLEEGLAAEEPGSTAAPEPAPEPPAAAEVEVLTDQIASLRDLVTSEVDGLRQAVDRVAEAAAAPPEPPAVEPPVPAGPAQATATLDERTLELLRDEIRGAGAIGDQVVDALREELKALRRRIAVKASERVLDDQQLAQIADAVAARLDTTGEG